MPFFSGHGEKSDRQRPEHQNFAHEDEADGDDAEMNYSSTKKLIADRREVDGTELAQGNGEHLDAAVAKICVCAAILLLLWGAVSVMRRRRYAKFGCDGNSAIQIVSRLSIGQKHHLAVVSCEQKRFLIGITQHGIGRIGSLGEGPLRVVQKSASTDGKTA